MVKHTGYSFFLLVITLLLAQGEVNATPLSA